MKTAFHLLVFLLMLSYEQARTQTPNWTQAFAGVNTGDTKSTSVAIDDKGNIYVTGWFKDTLTLGTIHLQSAGGNDMFLAKYNAAGSVIWAKHIGSKVDDHWGIPSLTVDRAGTIYLTGTFSDTADFDGNIVTAVGWADIFFAKYRTDGQLAWVKSYGTNYVNIGAKITLSASGFLYATGSYGSDGGSPPSHWSINFDGITLTSAGGSDVFVVKMDTNGSCIWARSAGGVYPDNGWGITLDASENVLITGAFSDPWMFFGTYKLLANGQYGDMFLAKYDSSGNFVWARSAGSELEDYGIEVAVDQQSNVYVSGTYHGNLNFGTVTLAEIGDYDIFLAKYSSAGGLLWAKKAGGTGSDELGGMVADGAGNVYISGDYGFDGVFGSDTLHCNGTNVYVTKYDGNGNVKWAVQPTAANATAGYSIVKGNVGDLYVTGAFGGSAQFGATTIQSAIGANMYIARLSAATGIGGQNSKIPQMSMFPNPVENVLTIKGDIDDLTDIEIFDVRGILVYKKDVGKTNGNLSADLALLANGVYTVRLSGEKIVHTQLITVYK